MTAVTIFTTTVANIYHCGDNIYHCGSKYLPPRGRKRNSIQKNKIVLLIVLKQEAHGPGTQLT
jgi:hypothetical protein